IVIAAAWVAVKFRISNIVGPVPRAIIDDNQLPIRERLLFHARDRLDKKLPSIECWENDGNKGGRSTDVVDHDLREQSDSNQLQSKLLRLALRKTWSRRWHCTCERICTDGSRYHLPQEVGLSLRERGRFQPVIIEGLEATR